jgi:hypothetical protein
MLSLQARGTKFLNADVLWVPAFAGMTWDSEPAWDSRLGCGSADV